MSMIELIGSMLLIGVKHSPMLIPFYQVPKAVFPLLCIEYGGSSLASHGVTRD